MREFSKLEVMQELRVVFPSTVGTVKRAFRARALELHPDRNRNADAHVQMAKLQSVFDFTMTRSDWFVEAASPQSQQKTASGEFLRDLGQGIGPAANGATCDSCDGRGYRSVVQSDEPCPVCKKFPCRRCDGGKIKLQRSARFPFVCPAAGCDNGVVWIKSILPCDVCMDSRRVKRVIHYLCHVCSGCGETAMFNPVIRKGAIRGAR